MNAIKIEFGIQTKAAKNRTWLAFELLPGAFPQQWAAAFSGEIRRKKLWHFNFGSLFVNEPHYRKKIEAKLKSLRQTQEISPFIKRKVLESILQNCFEIKSTLKGKGKDAKVAQELIELVRHYMQIYHPEFHFHISLQAYLPQAYHLPALAHSLFTCDRKDGWLYLDYIGQGQDSFSCYNEKSASEHEPQRLFSGNSQILYRENFDGSKLKAEVTNWLIAQDQPCESVGLIPLAKPLHTYSRNEVRDLFSKSNSNVEVRFFRDGLPLKLAALKKAHFNSRPYYPGGLIQAAMKACGLGLLRITLLDRPVNFSVDCYHRYGVSFWIVKQPYYWLKPRAFQAYFTLSWPIRKLYYFAKFQYEKRILRSLK